MRKNLLILLAFIWQSNVMAQIPEGWELVPNEFVVFYENTNAKTNRSADGALSFQYVSLSDNEKNSLVNDPLVALISNVYQQGDARLALTNELMILSSIPIQTLLNETGVVSQVQKTDSICFDDKLTVYVVTLDTKDPLVEYKHEAFGIFKAMIDQVYKETAQNLFRLTLKRINEAEQMWENVSPEMFQELFENIDPSTLPMPENEEERQQLLNFLAQMQNNKMAEENANNFAMDNMPEEENAEPLIPYQRESAKIGRNDPCPCGSGKKYKKCCGAN